MNLNQLKKFVLLFALLVALQCSGNGKVLATFDGGTVTKQDLLFYIDFIKKSSPQNNLETIQPEIQAKILEQIAIQRIIYDNSLKTGAVKKEDVEKLDRFFSASSKAQDYFQQYTNNVIKQTPINFRQLQIMVIRKPDLGDLKEVATNHLNALNALGSKKEQGAYISKNTQELSRKPLLGITDPLCSNCGPNQFQDFFDVADSAKGSEFLLYLPPGSEELAYIFRNYKSERVHPQRLSVYFTKLFQNFKKDATDYLKEENIDPKASDSKKELTYYANLDPEEYGSQFANFITNQFEKYQLSQEFQRIEKEAGLSRNNSIGNYNLEKAKIADIPADTVLLESAEKKITFGEVVQLYQSFPSFVRPENKGDNVELRNILSFFQESLFFTLTMENSSRIQKMRLSPSYEFGLDQQRVSVAMTVFEKEMMAFEPKITDQQILDEYETGKMFAYSTPDPSNPQIRKPMPLASVRDKIKSSLEDRARKGFKGERLQALKQSYNLIIKEKELEPISVL